MGRKEIYKSAFINKIRIDLVDEEKSLSLCREYIKGDGCHQVFFINAHCFNIAENSQVYKKVLNDASLVLNDGSGIKLASLIHGFEIKENMNGTDFIPKLLDLATHENAGVFLLGATPENVDLAVANIRENYPGINIAGHRNGYFTNQEDQEIIDQINKSQASMLVVGMGVPRQELWVSNNKDKFSHVKLAIAGGACIDFLSGNIKRAPRWMQVTGIEWLFRLAQEPRRLMNRYLIGNFRFVASVVRHKFKKNYELQAFHK